MKAMILAAGRGERMRPLTDTTPKSLIRVRGKSLLEWHLENIRNAGFEDVVINLGWLGDQIIKRVGSGSGYGLNVTYSDERDEVLETGGGIYKALPFLGPDPFLVVNADIFTDMPIPEARLLDNDLGHLVLVPSPEYREVGDFDIDDGVIRNGKSPDLTFSGIAIYRPDFFEHCEGGRFSIVPMLREAADAGRLLGSVYKGQWSDIGTPERLTEINGQSAK
jgi:MurNAc alpha-1-phosphate uridylyltransferase